MFIDVLMLYACGCFGTVFLHNGVYVLFTDERTTITDGTAMYRYMTLPLSIPKRLNIVQSRKYGSIDSEKKEADINISSITAWAKLFSSYKQTSGWSTIATTLVWHSSLPKGERIVSIASFCRTTYWSCDPSTTDVNLK
jgi:hypothetical protein